MIHIGSSYYLPHHGPGDWERDFASMADSGHTAVRTGELLASWDLMEREPGRPDLSSLERAFELAGRHGLKVLLGTGACSPPVWMLAEHPDLCIVDRDGIAYAPGGMWGWACINHPAYLEESDRFLGQLLERFGGEAQLLGWQVHNEPGYPFVPREDRDAPAWFDYNGHTVRAFRKWLEGRYGTVEALNEAWLWVPSNTAHRSFDEVQAPRHTPREWGSASAWLDWRRFAYDNWGGLVARQAALIKESHPESVTMTNVYGGAYDGSGRLGSDSWTLPRHCDAIGYDMYPGMGRPPAGDGEARRNQAAFFLDFAASTAGLNGRELWLPEMEAGPLDGWAMGPGHPTSAADITRWGMMALARGARTILYQGYRQWESLALNWGGLAGWRGEPTERLAASADLAGFVSDNAGLLEGARPARASVAILHSSDNTVFCASTVGRERADRAIGEAHDTLWRLGHTVGFVDPDHVDAIECAAIVLPFSVLVSRKCAVGLAAYVERGGCLISMPRTAMVDERGGVWPERPGGGLSGVFGAREKDIRAEGKAVVTYGDGEAVPGFHHRQELEVGEGVEVIGRFGDGSPAITRKRHGRGVAVHCATHLDAREGDVGAHLRFWRWLLDGYGVRPTFALGGQDARCVDLRTLEAGDGGRVLFASNEGVDDVMLELTLEAGGTSGAEVLWGGGGFEPAGDGGSFGLSLAAGKALVVRLPG